MEDNSFFSESDGNVGQKQENPFLEFGGNIKQKEDNPFSEFGGSLKKKSTPVVSSVTPSPLPSQPDFLKQGASLADNSFLKEISKSTAQSVGQPSYKSKLPLEGFSQKQIDLLKKGVEKPAQKTSGGLMIPTNLPKEDGEDKDEWKLKNLVQNVFANFEKAGTKLLADALTLVKDFSKNPYIPDVSSAMKGVKTSTGESIPTPWELDPSGTVIRELHGNQERMQQVIANNPLPNTFWGKAVSSVNSFIPDIAVAGLFPETKLAQGASFLAKTGKLLINPFTKYITTKEALSGYGEASKEGKDIGESSLEGLKGAGRGLKTGVELAILGAGSNVATKSVMNKLEQYGLGNMPTKELVNLGTDLLAYSIISPYANAGLEGRLATADEIANGAGVAALFRLKGAAENIKSNVKLNKALEETLAMKQGAAVSNFVDATPKSIVEVYNSKESADEFQLRALAAAKKARETTDLQKKAKYVVEASTLVRAANVKQVADMVINNRDGFAELKASDLPESAKNEFLQKAEEINKLLNPFEKAKTDLDNKIKESEDLFSQLSQQAEQSQDPNERAQLEAQAREAKDSAEKFRNELAEVKFNQNRPDANAGKEPVMEGEVAPTEVKIGDSVQWTSQGTDQFTEPRKIKSISEDGKYAFVEGSDTGIPVAELSVTEVKPSEVKVNELNKYNRTEKITPDVIDLKYDDNGKEVGGVILGKYGNYLTLDRIYFSPEYRGTGLSKYAYKDALEMAKSQGYEGLMVGGQMTTEYKTKETYKNFATKELDIKNEKGNPYILLTDWVGKEVKPTEVKSIEQLRAEEQAELDSKIPNAEQYRVEGKVDRTKLTNEEDIKAFDEVYNKYDKLISPLLKKPAEQKITVELLSSQEPPQKEGETIVTLSGKTEKERLESIERRQSSTKVTDKVLADNALIQRAQSYFKKTERYKNTPEGRAELNKLRLDARDLGLTVDTERNKVTTPSKKTGRPRKVPYNNKADSDAIVESSGKTLTERSRDVQDVFEELTDAGVFLDIKSESGNRMSAAQIDAAVSDILEGIPSKAANKYLDALEKGLAEDAIPLYDKGMGGFAPKLADIRAQLGVEKEVVGEPMDEVALNKFLDEESKLTPEEEQDLLDNVENLLYEYETTEAGPEGKVQPIEAGAKEGVPSEAKPSEPTKSERQEAKQELKPVKESAGKPKEEIKPTEFKDFTSKSGNKVVDEKGEPKVVFTGTNANKLSDIDALYFENDKTVKEKLSDMSPHYQIFFTDNKNEAKSYGKNIFEANVYIKNPVKNKADLVKTKSQLIKEGYDGYIWKSDDGRTHYIVFDKSQIQEVKPTEVKTKEEYEKIKSNKKKKDFVRNNLPEEFKPLADELTEAQMSEIVDSNFDSKTIKNIQDAIQKQSAAEVLQPKQEEIGGTGGGRERVEQGKQGDESTGEGKAKVAEEAQPKGSEKVEVEKIKTNDKSILNRINSSENIPDSVKEKFKDNLRYEVKSKEEAKIIAKNIIKEYGTNDAVTLAEANKFHGDVNSFIFSEAINDTYVKETEAKTPEEKLKYAEQWADYAIRFDESARSKGRFISAISDFYKKSPLGIKFVENERRSEDFKKWYKAKEGSYKEVFDELVQDPKFKSLIGEEVQKGLKEERAAQRQANRKKIEDFFENAKLKGNNLYAVPIPPKVINGALEIMKQSVLAGESVVYSVNKAIEHISKEVKDWDKEKFRKEYETKLSSIEGKSGKTEKEELPEDAKNRILDKFRKKLKGLNESQKEQVIRRSFKQLVENGALEYNDFKKIISETIGYGEITPEEAAKITKLVNDINSVDELASSIRDEGNRSEANLLKYQKAKKEAEKSATELNKMVYNKTNISNRLLSVMQLNTLGIPSLVNNPIFNIWNQATVRFPNAVSMTVLDQILYRGSRVSNKLFGTGVLLPENNVLTSQKEFFKKGLQGGKLSAEQLFTGLTNRDYFQKEIYSSQIHPFTSIKDLWDWKFKGKNLTPAQVADKSIQATVGLPAEIVARALNIGDKPQRFAAEGAQAAVFAKNLGLKDIDYEYFLEFPKEEAYRAFKRQGFSDDVAMKKAEEIQERIIKQGEESTFQQDNLLNDAVNSAFKVFGTPGEIFKKFNMPYLKIPLNAFWSVYNLVNPEVAFLQSAVYGTKAIKSGSSLDIQQSKKWFAHGVTGIALTGIAGALASNGIVNSNNADDTTKKERIGEKTYEQQNSINVTKLNAYLRGENPDDVKNSLNVDLKWFGNVGNILNVESRKLEEMTPEQRKNGMSYMEDMFSSMKISSIELIENGVFSNTSGLLTAIDRGGNFADAYVLNLINMGTNIVQPAMFAQMSRAELPYYSQQKADTFMEQLKNNLLTRSSTLRALSGKYPPSQVGVWGDKLDRKDNIAMKLFGISSNNNDNFAQPIYNDYKKTDNTAFLPPSVKPEVNGFKLNTSEANKLEILVGQARKNLVAPFVNDGAKLSGFKDRYSKLSEEDKVKALGIIYKMGYQVGEKQFTDLYPQFYKSDKKTPEQKKESKESSIFRKSLKKFIR